MRKVTGVALITGAVLLAGCGSASGTSDHSRSPSPRTGGGSAPGKTPVRTAAAGPSQLVLRGQVSGGIAGFGGPGELPEFSLYGDGRAIAPKERLGGSAAQPMEYRLTSAALQRLIDDAYATGLDRSRTVDRQGVADATYLKLTFTAGGKTATTRVIEVGTENDPAEQFWRQRLHAQGNGPGWPKTDLMSDPAPYKPARLAVLAVESVQTTGTQPTNWPLGRLDRGEPVGVGLCTLFTGHELDRATRLFHGAAPDARWLSGGKIYTLRVRPLLPDEQNCRALNSP
ncbi:MAG: putative secreted protein [Actinomycetia bacterium]|nr:putative secreted protein [Actinomycetes bacterium]